LFTVWGLIFESGELIDEQLEETLDEEFDRLESTGALDAFYDPHPICPKGEELDAEK